MRLRYLVGAVAFLCTQFSWGGLPYNVESTLGKLRERHRAGEKADRQFRDELKDEIDGLGGKNGQRTASRLPEFQFAARLLGADIPPLPESKAGPSRMWASRTRGSYLAVDAALRFNCGPGKAVSPSNGEYCEEVADFSFSERGELAFSFNRRYASFSEFDCGFGIGWDHNYNSGVVFEGDEVAKAQSCVVFWRGRDIRFEKRGGVWWPAPGCFLSIEIAGDRVILRTPQLIRAEFELASEQKPGECRWRLSAVASRHDSWKANRIELDYLDGCDRLKSITGVRGERIDFAYDAAGHVVGINSKRKSIRYEYDSDRLVRVRCSPISLTALGGRMHEPVVSYDYAKAKGVSKLCRKELAGQSYHLDVSYDEEGRVVRCGYVSKDAEQMWQLSYTREETIVKMPKPSAAIHYFWGGTSHASLPCRMEVPLQKTVVRYAFNADYLPTEEVDSLGVQTVQEYDSKNDNPLMRGNLLLERRLAGPGEPIKWREFGVRTVYEKEIALPVMVETYQIETNGVEEVVRREMFKYRRSDYSLTEKRETGGAERGGVLVRFVNNRYGEIGLERDAKDNVTIYEYADALPQRVDFGFVPGSAANGGLLVRKIEDATGDQIRTACRALSTSVSRNEIVRVKPCALETLYAWDCDGNQIRVRCGYNEKLSLYNEKRATLAEFDNGDGLELTEYQPDGRVCRVLSEFSPDERSDYRGQPVSFFSGQFKEASFEFDSLGQMSARMMTDEKIDGVVPKDTFVRYPSGKIAKIVNPSGVTRVDTYDSETGFLVSQHMKGRTEDIPLGRIIERFPGGSIKVHEDKMGAVWTNRLDSFGRPYEAISCTGTTTRELRDSLDRIVEACVFDDTKVYSMSKMSFSRENGFVESERMWKSDDGKSGVWIESKRHLYDDAGNEVGTKGVHEKGWTYSLYDGLGRRVATADPVGGVSVVVYDADCEAYAYTVAKRDDAVREEFMQGNLHILDDAGRVIEAIPVDSKGRLARERSVKSEYNAIGQVVRTKSMGLSASENVYNSLGWVVKEISSPLTARQGELPIVVSTTFRADGKVVRRELGNTALALVGSKSNVRPERVDAPQTTIHGYDEYGRLRQTENPDGLILTSTFNRHSMPSQMTWTHHSTTDVLRKIEFTYSPLGQVQRLFDGKTKDLLQEFTYDGAGMMTKAVDWNGGEQVVLVSKYDTFGQKVESQTILSGRVFPKQQFDYDPVKGVVHSMWAEEMSGAFWGKETVRTDAAGRLRSISLDADRMPLVEWQYMGVLPLRRKVNPSSINTEYSYTSLGEVHHQTMCDSFTGEEVGRLDHAYDPHGLMRFSSTLLKSVDKSGEDYQFASYSHFDDFRRLTGQNAEFTIPDKDSWPEEWERVFGHSERSLANQNTLRMRYDQANNIWVKYQGEEFEGEADKFNRIQSPKFISSARPFPEGGFPDKHELASNREVSSASYGETGLVANVKEYDLLGNLVEFKGDYWDGTRKIPVMWKLEYDPLGRLVRMVAKSEDDSENALVKRGVLAGVLDFAYDAQNRRIMKRVVDRPSDKASTNTTFTIYSGMRQELVYADRGGQLNLIEEYLWGAGERELVMAALTSDEKDVSARPVRYYFQQDHGYNCVFATKTENGRRIPVSVSSYLGFGDNATVAKIRDSMSSMRARDKECAYNNKKDERLTATWVPDLKAQQFIELKMYDVRRLSAMTIWGATGFPRDFLVYVLPTGTDSPEENGFDLNQWHYKNRNCLAAVVKDGLCLDYQKQDSEYSPYKVSLSDMKGDRIVIAWEQKLDDDVKIKEVEVVCSPANPSAIAYAGQWLDRETGMYYQINRYRIAGSDKFISPDPLGFAAGDNLYAYANGNPLEWHDPDGRSPQLVAAGIGAVIGAVMGGGSYALQCWIHGDEFSWEEFGIQTLVGAVSGAVGGLLLDPALALSGMVGGGTLGTSVAGAAIGAGSGFCAGALNEVLHGLANGDDVSDVAVASLTGGLRGMLTGAVGGAVGGAVAGKIGYNPKHIPRWIRAAAPRNQTGQYFMRGIVVSGVSGAIGGAAGGTVDGIFTAIDTGDYRAIVDGIGSGALYGTLGAVGATTIANSFERVRYGRDWRVKMWDKARNEYWKNEARSNPNKYSADNLARMKQGKAPQRWNPVSGRIESMQLNHQNLPRGSGLPMSLLDLEGNLKPMWPDEHSTFHSQNGYGKWN